MCRISTGNSVSSRQRRASRRQTRPVLPSDRVGFDRPGDLNIPEVPANLTATAGAPGSHILSIHGDDSRRADGYRVRVVNVATGAEMASQLAQDAEAAIGDLPAGLTVGVSVTARNAAGESQPSDAVQIVVP